MSLTKSKSFRIFVLCNHVILLLAFTCFLANQLLSYTSIAQYFSVFTLLSDLAEQIFSFMAIFPLQVLALLVFLHIPSVVITSVLYLIISKLLYINAIDEAVASPS